MFTTKQSDIFYNDQTKEMFVCKVSSISAKRCEGSEDIVYGALPIVYKINKETNYQSLIYPKNLDTFKDDIKSDLYDLVPSNCYADGTNFAHVTKPLINYNKSSDRYSITFVGKYTATSDGFGVLNYIFQYIDTDFHLLDSEIYIPKAKATKTPPFTFNSGYLNSDLIIGGNKLRWNEPVDTAYAERVANYVIKPTHLDHNNSLGFNLIQYCPPKGQHCYLPTTKYPLLWSGGYITYNPKYTAFDPAYDIRVDFRARSFNVPSMTAYKSIQSSNDDSEPSRWLDTATALSGLSGAGSGFCVYFYNAPTRHPIEWVREGIVEPNGIGSTLGYAIAGNVGTEDGGELTEVNGLVVNPSGNIGGQTGPDAESFLGVGFDIRGDFCTTSESKEGWLSASDTFKAPTASTWTTSPCSVGIRGNRNHYTRVLTCVPMVSVVAASAVPMHEDASTSGGGDVAFQDYRVDLTNKGTRVTVYNKLTSATDYNTIVQLDLNKTYGCVGYDAWGNIGEPLITNPTLTPLNVGLSFTTSEYCSYFELSSFEVTGVKIGNPNKTPKEIDNVTTVEYLEESSANLRRDLVTLPTTDPVDITMLITRESLIDRINLCGNLLPPVEYEIEEKWTGTKEIIEFKPPPPPCTTCPPPECQPGWYSSWPMDHPLLLSIVAGENLTVDSHGHKSTHNFTPEVLAADWSDSSNPNIFPINSSQDNDVYRGYVPIAQGGDGITVKEWQELNPDQQGGYYYGFIRKLGITYWSNDKQTLSQDYFSVVTRSGDMYLLGLTDPAHAAATAARYAVVDGGAMSLPEHLARRIYDWALWLGPEGEYEDSGYTVMYKWKDCDVAIDYPTPEEPTPIKLNQSCWRHYCHFYFDSHKWIETFIIGFEVKGVNQYIVAQAALYHKGFWYKNKPKSETIDIYVYDDNKKQTVNLFEGNDSTKIWINGWVEHAYPQEKLNSIAEALDKHIQNADPKIDLTQPNFWLLEPSDWLTFKHLGNSPPDIDCNLNSTPLIGTLNAMSFTNCGGNGGNGGDDDYLPADRL